MSSLSKPYVVGHYRYREMRQAGMAVARQTNIDSLPPTMLTCIETVYTTNAREAKRLHHIGCWRSTDYQKEQAIHAKEV